MSIHSISLLTVILIITYIISFLVGFRVVMTARSSQAAVAWLIALITFPYIALVFYAVFGRSQFNDYAEAMRQSNQDLIQQLQTAKQDIATFNQDLPHPLVSFQTVIKNLTGSHFTHSNSVQLLIDGKQTYQVVFDAIQKAKDYILLQFYIVRSDHIGQIFKEILIKKARQGVRIYFLYDAWGSHSLKKLYLRSLSQAGIHVSALHDASNTLRSRLQLNFRNHKKIVIVDGESAYIGGLNIGEEYLGRLRKFGPWRDTHLELKGPMVQSIQLSFCADWYWAQRAVLNLNWQITPAPANQSVMVLSCGPDLPLPVGALAITQIINTACERLWIASPYFVPDQNIMSALQLAVLRGVDVRILLPNRADHFLVYMCSFSFYNEMQAAGIKLYRYTEGFMHQKVILVDESLASVGTINLDNRSLYLNFEMNALVSDPIFIKQVCSMLEQDFAHAYQVNLGDFHKFSYFFKVAARLSRLVAPIL